MILLLWLLPALAVQAHPTDTHRLFRVKYVAEGVVYLDSGRNAGLVEGQLLKISPSGTDEGSSRGEQLAAEEIATVRILSLADASAVCEVLSSSRTISPGDVAILPPGSDVPVPPREAERPYLQTVAFTTDDPLEEEKRAAVPRPPLPEINRTRGRIGIEYSALIGRGQVTTRSSNVGLVLRANMTRIGGSYWNFNGYWRGRLSRRSSDQVQSVSDLTNRTYQLGLAYSNPFSSFVAGVGRQYLPWASSLEIFDGGYLGLRSDNGVVVGTFAGTTPDPASWSYNPNRRLGGTFVAVERGTFEDVHILSTMGIALSGIGWRTERQFLFSENSFSYRRTFTVFQSMQVDTPHTFSMPNPAQPGATVATRYGGINRSYLTFRWQPKERLSFDLSHSYFQGLPTFDPVLIGTGLLDRYLFQGLSAGVRAQPIRNITLYTSAGRNSRSGDQKASWNQMYGITFADLFQSQFRMDARYSRFTSLFGQGDYESLSISRQLTDAMRMSVMGGIQSLRSSLTPASRSHFVTAESDWSPGRHLFFQTFFTWQRGGQLNYDQFSIVMGSRF